MTIRNLAAVCLLWLAAASLFAQDIAATHIYHNHMPNFWPYYDVSTYNALPVGAPIRYTFDGQVIDLKNSPPSNYTYYLPNGSPMPHDDLVAYYTHHAKTGAYLYWPWQTAQANSTWHPLSQTHVTMSASVITNVNSFMYTNNVPGYANTNWGSPWRTTNRDWLTTNGKRRLDLIHFTGHHSMGPLVGSEYFLKDLIYQNVVLAQDFFLGSDFKSSKGFFPTELGFSERLIPELVKLGIEWSVIGNNHFSRTLKDYPYLNDPGVDTLISPPNRADLQNESNIGDWVSLQMFNEAQVTQNKFPFASIPHWVRYVDPDTGQDFRIAGIPVEQASSWEEGYQGSVTAGVLHNYVAAANTLGRKQYFVIAHDGDNSSGRAGSGDTWLNSGQVTYSENGVQGMGVDEYLQAHPIPANDVVHVQDGSWIDTRDSSSDPTWYHWHLPPCIWQGQFSDFNNATGTDYAPKQNLDGVTEGNTVSLEYGYHYLERNFALLQPALNYAKTAEQIWLDDNPNHWSPSTSLDNEVTYAGNQLNPWMLSFPVKGDPNNNWAGGANPAELAWYFLIASIDSGFGYYDENVDDHVKPTVSFNQSLYFSEAYVQARLSDDRTGPSVWWPQRWPYNPGSANASKAEGWTTHYFDQNFAIYTYAYDLSGISDIKVMIRTHTNDRVDPLDNTPMVYDPAALAAAGVPNIDTSRVGAWTAYPMIERDLSASINGVPWQQATSQTMAVVPAQKIGNLFYTYLGNYQDQLLDYYIEATDTKGNVTRSKIQQVYVGAGRYKMEGGKRVEDVNGPIAGTYPFVTDQTPQRTLSLYVADAGATTVEVSWNDDGTWTTPAAWSASTIPGYTFNTLNYNTDDGQVTVRYRRDGGAWLPDVNGATLTASTWTFEADNTVSEITPNCTGCNATVYYKPGYGTPYIHYRPAGETWTTPPGVAMTASTTYPGYFEFTAALGSATQLEVAFNDGAGAWDSNGGANFLFGIGESTFDNGVITAGAPTVVIPPPLDPISVTVHYQRADDTYAPWGLHLWGTGVPATTWAAPHAFDGSDAWGATATFDVDAGTTAVNFLVHMGNTKDVDQDRVFDPSVNPEIWLMEGDAQIYTSQPGGTDPVDPPVGGPIVVTVHYQRGDGNYTPWGLHLWGDGVPATTWAAPRAFDGADAWGGTSTFNVDAGTTVVNFIVHAGNTKDVDQDRSFDPSVTPEVWLLEGDATVYTSQPMGPAPITVRVHYQRSAGDYTDWGLHLWGNGLDGSETATFVNGYPSTEWNGARHFEGTDSDGVYADILLTDANETLFFIVHKGNDKDISQDRSFQPSASMEVWLIQGDGTIYTSNPHIASKRRVTGR